MDKIFVICGIIIPIALWLFGMEMLLKKNWELAAIGICVSFMMFFYIACSI